MPHSRSRVFGGQRQLAQAAHHVFKARVRSLLEETDAGDAIGPGGKALRSVFRGDATQRQYRHARGGCAWPLACLGQAIESGGLLRAIFFKDRGKERDAFIASPRIGFHY